MPVVRTESNLCKRCYACVRNCPVKAIKVEDGQASVTEASCITCGACKNVCSQQAKQIRRDVDNVRQLLEKDSTVVALMAPAFAAAFDYTPYQVLGAMKEAGFSQVCEVAYGAELVAREYNRMFADKRLAEPLLTSPCPAVINLIEKHYPRLVSQLIPVVSPMIAAARLARKIYGERINTVFIGPCVAKKSEINHPSVSGDVDYALTFSELKELLSDRNCTPGIAAPAEFDGWGATLGGAFPLAGGLLKAAGLENDILAEQFVVVEGRQEVMETLHAIETKQFSPALIDILYCRGCIDGPDLHNSQSLNQRKKKVIDFIRQRRPAVKEPPEAGKIKLSRKFIALAQKALQPSEHEIRDILKATGKFNVSDELNCGACGYDTCRDKAKAVYHGLAEANMCLPFLLHKSEQEIAHYRQEIQLMETFQGISQQIIGDSKKVKTAKNFVLKAAQSASTVLLLGESGTGKGLFARAIHFSGNRKDGPFIKVNCSAIPETLLESELFGYEEGSFTGAQKGGKIGKFELANGGTIFLDEIGDMPFNMQAKMLRVLQEREIERIGGHHSIPIDVRVIAATNRDLREEIKANRFREDLYYRLDVLSISIPPLREMASDIPVLTQSLIERICKKHHVPPKKVSEEVMGVFCRYPWPGNVRELENMLERLLNLVEEDIINIDHLPAHLWQHIQSSRYLASGHSLDNMTSEVERDAIINALKATKNNRSKAAKLLGLHRSTFYEKLKRYDLL
ncbi:sigma 54-interacting transcriptional regulator [Dethiobacter alkaliphilus]|uniref:Sigma54 specific transcriptional regulator, Fis family n=1 Tax=Dethiobacter alkaliphilus AHT 1 TaxID=555088 RepID=C0GH19_DETAL|nr:sigma 54-interacting transcriptional regulator [Dethiobacter alkaliphilus]EEG77321.1 sigma54 specific transcriptional regulator, Fis family [Dethiobacter alkaliphilus AHT 1]